MKNQLTTGVAVFAATAILFLGIGAAIAATTTTLSPFPVGSTTAVSCAAGSGKLKNFSVETDSETVSCPAPTTTTTTVPPTTTTTVAGTSGGSPTLSASAAEYIVETVNSQGTSSAGAVLTLSSANGAE